MKNKNALYIMIILAVLLLTGMEPIAAFASAGKAVLVVVDSRDQQMKQREEALKKYLVYYRQKYGKNSANLPILIYDFADSRTRKYCRDKLSIGKEDLLFLGIVSVRGNVPLKVHLKVADPKNLESNAKSVVQRMIGKPVAAGEGVIRVSSSPSGAEVWTGAKYRGVTPAIIKGLAPGMHTLAIKKKGFVPARREVLLKKGASESVRVKLSRAGAALTITSEPSGAEVYIDGINYGKTPITLHTLSTGRHGVTLKLGDKQWNGTAKVLPDKGVEIAHFFGKKPQPGPAPTPKTTPSPISSGPVKEAFVPRSQTNSRFRITVSNIEEAEIIKDHYKPKPGYKFVIVYLSQQNISNELQVYSGQISLVDSGSTSHDHLEKLSNFWMMVMRPGGIITGYMVFEIPKDLKPMKVVLHGMNMPPLSVMLR